VIVVVAVLVVGSAAAGWRLSIPSPNGVYRLRWNFLLSSSSSSSSSSSLSSSLSSISSSPSSPSSSSSTQVRPVAAASSRNTSSEGARVQKADGGVSPQRGYGGTATQGVQGACAGRFVCAGRFACVRACVLLRSGAGAADLAHTKGGGRGRAVSRAAVSYEP
jgi:hypothetical protein